MTNHGGTRAGSGIRRNYPFFSKLERLAFLSLAERNRYMAITPRQRVLQVIYAPTCDDCGDILDVLPDGKRICNECN